MAICRSGALRSCDTPWANSDRFWLLSVSSNCCSWASMACCVWFSAAPMRRLCESSRRAAMMLKARLSLPISLSCFAGTRVVSRPPASALVPERRSARPVTSSFETSQPVNVAMAMAMIAPTTEVVAKFPAARPASATRLSMIAVCVGFAALGTPTRLCGRNTTSSTADGARTRKPSPSYLTWQPRCSFDRIETNLEDFPCFPWAVFTGSRSDPLPGFSYF